MNGQIRIGRFILTEVDDEHIWISVEGGEGGQFSRAEFEKAVEVFYRENF